MTEESTRRFENKVVVVTGAARGQGRSHALRFAAEGASIIAIDICKNDPAVFYPLATREDLDDTVALVEKEGVRAVSFVADVSDSAAVTAAIDAGVEQLGGLDAVSVNAGVATDYATFEETSDAAWEASMAANLTGAFYTARAAIPHLRARGGGSVIFTGSICSIKGMPNGLAYNASKHGLLALMRTMAVEYGPDSIRSNAVLPSTVNTPMVNNEVLYRIMRPELEDPQFEDALEAIGKINVLPVQILAPGDISDAVLWLASDQAKYITGAALPVDAGALTK